MKHKKIWMFAAVFAAVLVFFTVTVFGVLARRTDSLRDDWSVLLEDPALLTAVRAEGVEPVTQEISCGYAVIEMFSSWAGGSVTEESLYAENNGISTSTGEAFAEELNRQIPDYTFTRQIYLPDSQLLRAVHSSLSSGIPVPVEWAAQDSSGSWTLHYSLITALDLRRSEIEVVNPYGYIETLSIPEFLDRTSFRAYTDLPLPYQFGFAFGLFEKNTIFPAQPAAD